MKKETATIYMVLVINFILSLIQVIFGHIGNSSAVVADGIHTFSYIITNFIAAIGDKISKKPATSRFPFGYGRIQYFTSIIIGFALSIIGLLIVVNVINVKLLNPNFYVLMVVMFVILCKKILAEYLARVYKKTENSIINAMKLESDSDVKSSLVVLLIVSLSYIGSKSGYLIYLDYIAAIVLSFFIIKTGIEIIIENIGEIIGEKEVSRDRIKNIREVIQDHKDIHDVKKLFLLKYGPYSKLYLEVKMAGKLSLNVINRRLIALKKAIKKSDKKIKYINIIVEPVRNNK